MDVRRWTIEFQELQMGKKIGEGSFGQARGAAGRDGGHVGGEEGRTCARWHGQVEMHLRGQVLCPEGLLVVLTCFHSLVQVYIATWNETQASAVQETYWRFCLLASSTLLAWLLLMLETHSWQIDRKAGGRWSCFPLHFIPAAMRRWR